MVLGVLTVMVPVSLSTDSGLTFQMTDTNRNTNPKRNSFLHHVAPSPWGGGWVRENAVPFPSSGLRHVVAPEKELLLRTGVAI